MKLYSCTDGYSSAVHPFEEVRAKTPRTRRGGIESETLSGGNLVYICICTGQMKPTYHVPVAASALHAWMDGG